MSVLRRAVRGAAALALVALASGAPAQERPPYKDPSLPVDQRVADLLGRMTLEEKVAQTWTLWQGKGRILDEAGNFSPEKAAAAIPDGIGQIARPNDGFGAAAVDKRDPRQTAELVNAVQRWAVEQTRLGIPVLFHEEALHGNQALRGTNFPVPIALAGSFDPDLVERVMTVAAREVRVRGGRQVLAPVLDLLHDPRWGRSEETYGEDPYLAGTMGAAAIRGYQGPLPLTGDHVLATAKHFAVHGPSEGGINTAPGNISERLVREMYLPSFRRAIVDEGVASVMASYNEIDGVPAHVNRWLLEEVLRREWGFRGYVVADYNAIDQLVGRHHVAVDREDAARQALEAGVDIELPDPQAYATLADQVRSGRIAESTLDTAVARLLRGKFLAGLFEDPWADPDRADAIVNSEEHRALALEAARRSIVLLRNEGGILPLDRSRLSRIAVIGPNAGAPHLGGYSDDPQRGVSVLQGVRDLLGDAVEVLHAEGCRLTESPVDWWADEVIPADPAKNRERIAEAVAVASRADAVLLVLGGNESTSREAWADNHLGDRDDLGLLGQQDELIDAVLATGKPTVAFLIHGRPLAIGHLVEKVPGILDGWYLGQEGGTAAAEAVFGELNPGAKLAVSVPRSVGQIPVYYDRKPTSQRDYLFSTRKPLFAFGHGLSYTSFELADLAVSPAVIGTGGSAVVSVRVTNTGARPGDEVVQLYLRDRVSSVTRPVEELKGFRRVSLGPGESTTVEMTLGPDALSLVNRAMQRVVEPGSFDVMVGRSSEDLISATLEVVER